ncbi:SGNH/GDSL hydrolase family protein [Sinomonas sp. JGH33]|uniref:SGNH/GDSL hydrolase family protein n=1 Tax=Sinomonas terricola TaxID=3110330 RepID=A0ABU5T828_9MICC|nr:SGNH/GDSL hydrolase family protein [Sinomonas sp. JGH33]MEA5455690.1 SGNH/GDSL hydrolase family protein [Sinomonas sp. JGH33]
MGDSVRRRYVALGDSFTEGVGDVHPGLPNGVRGWADRVAEKLAKHEKGWEYANLAVRSKRLRQIIDDQLEPALALEPTLVTLYAGGNDILDVGTDMDRLLEEYAGLVARLAGTGATLVLFTGYDVKVAPLLEPLRRRNWQYNARVRELAREHRAVLVDYWCFDEYNDKRMWDADRLHMSTAGHKFLARQVLTHLGVPTPIKPLDWEPLAHRSTLEWIDAQREWLNDWVLPLIGRKLRGVTLGDSLRPRWPEPVKVPRKGGLRRYALEHPEVLEGRGPAFPL